MWALESSAFDDAVQTWTSADLDGEHSRIRFEEHHHSYYIVV